MAEQFVLVPVSPFLPKFFHIVDDDAAVDRIMGFQLNVIGDDLVGLRQLMAVVL
jgi:hypothetical protein